MRVKVDRVLVVVFSLFITVCTSIPGAYAGSESQKQKNGYSIGNTPAWVINNRYNPSHRLTSTQSSQYLLIDQQINVTSTAQNFYRYVTRPLSQVGVDQSSEIQIVFNPAFQRLILHSIQIIRNENTRDITQIPKVRLLQRENELEQGLQGGLTTAVINLQDVRVGDVIDYQYSIVGRNPVFGNKVFGFVTMDWEVHVDKLLIRVLTNDEHRLMLRTHNVDIKPEKAKVDGFTEYTVKRERIAPVLDDKEYPHGFTPYSWLEYSEYRSWDDVNRWAAALYQTEEVLSAPLMTLIDTLKKTSKTKEEYITNALFFVQNEIRYLGLEFGQNSHRPHQPNDVYEKRFGDCKDKSLLLNTILAKNGIRAYSALVSTNYRDAIKKDLPSPGVFNHVISMVELDGKNYWLDGTRTYQAGNLEQIGQSDYGYALVVGTHQLGLVDMYADKITSSRIEVEEDIVATSFDDPVLYSITTTYHKNAAEYQRYRFDNTSIEDIQRRYTEFFGRYYSDITPQKNISYTDDIQNNRFVIQESYEIGDYWKSDKKMTNSTMYVFSFMDYLNVPKVKKRSSPFYVGTAKSISHVTRLHYPEDVSLKFDEKPVSFKNRALEYTYTDSYSNNVYFHEVKLNITGVHVVPKELPDHIALVDEIKKDWDYTITFKNPTKIAGYRELLTLKRRLKELSK